MGRPKGSRNKTSEQLRQQLIDAHKKLGGTKFWLALGKNDPSEFSRIFARLIPSESHVRSDATVAIADIPLDEAKRVLAERAARALRPELVVDNTGEDTERPRVVNE